jgi:hypothetical protein
MSMVFIWYLLFTKQIINNRARMKEVDKQRCKVIKIYFEEPDT